MCEVFISADPDSYASRTRAVRLHGVVTSIRLENLYWDVLTEIGQRDGMNVEQLIEKLYDELVVARGEVGNFSSFLRVVRCATWRCRPTTASPWTTAFRSARWIRRLCCMRCLHTGRCLRQAPQTQWWRCGARVEPANRSGPSGSQAGDPSAPTCGWREKARTAGCKYATASAIAHARTCTLMAGSAAAPKRT